jgi:hypothetical protein
MPSPADVAPTNTTPGGAHPIGTAAGPLRPPRVERLVFRCEPSTAGVVMADCGAGIFFEP